MEVSNGEGCMKKRKVEMTPRKEGWKSLMEKAEEEKGGDDS
jgi:hypothetical protein